MRLGLVEGAPLHNDPTRAATAVARLRPYDAIAVHPAHAPGSQPFFKLDWNEATVSPSPRVVEALAAHLASGPGLNWYPPGHDAALTRALAEYAAVPESHVLATNGSDEALRLCCDTFLDAGSDVVVPEPTYAHFQLFARARDARTRPVATASPLERDVPAILGALRTAPRMLYLVNPNNPTGATYAAHEIETMLRSAPSTLVLVDEAYIEFGGESVASLTTRYPNLVVTRTFSKAFGLAALRIGYLVAGPAALASLRILYNPKSVSAPAQVAARAALGDLEHLGWYVSEVRAARQLLARWWRERGHEVVVGHGNFVLVRVGEVAATLARMKAARVFVRDRSSLPGLAGFVRISVGTVEQTRQLLERLERLDV